MTAPYEKSPGFGLFADSLRRKLSDIGESASSVLATSVPSREEVARAVRYTAATFEYIGITSSERWKAREPQVRRAVEEMRESLAETVEERVDRLSSLAAPVADAVSGTFSGVFDDAFRGMFKGDSGELRSLREEVALLRQGMSESTKEVISLREGMGETAGELASLQQRMNKAMGEIVSLHQRLTGRKMAEAMGEAPPPLQATGGAAESAAVEELQSRLRRMEERLVYLEKHGIAVGRTAVDAGGPKAASKEKLGLLRQLLEINNELRAA